MWVCVCAVVGGRPGEDEGTVAGHSHSETGVSGPAATEDSLQTRSGRQAFLNTTLI